MDIVNIEENKNNIVKKHNELVNKARYSLSEQSIKLLSMLICMIKKDDETFQEYAITVKDFAELKGSKSKDNYDDVHSVIRELLSSPVKIGDLQANFIASGEYKKGEAYATFEISQRMKPYLLQLKDNFLEYNIKDILMLKSTYVIRLYELIVREWKEYKHYNKSATKYTFELEIDKLRELFEIPKSQLYADIKRHIIDKAQIQFKEKTNISFTYKEQKLGRKVVRLQITVQDNDKGSADFMANRKLFIEHIRKEYKPNPDNNHYPIIVSTQKGDIKVNLKGEIYLSGDDITNYTAKESSQLWDWLYDLAKENPKALKDPNEKNLLQ